MGFGEVRLIPVNGYGPEDVLVDGEGRVYTGVADGRVLRTSRDGTRIDTIADTEGRPLGLEFFGDDELLVCDAYRGLLVVELAGGRVLDLLADGLAFANGVALAPDESFVAVAESGAYRVRRIGLTERTGDLLIDGLPGFPDNISTGTDGLIWVTQASPRVRALPRIQRLPAFPRAMVRALPRWLQPGPGQRVGVLGVGADGKVVHELSGVISGFRMLTGVRERAGTVCFGSLRGNRIAVTELPPIPRG
jgi:hypothetical protein